MTPRSVSLAVALLVGSAAGAGAQDLDVEHAVERLAAFWARGDAAALATMTARTGLSIDIDGEPMGPLGARQVAAMLRRIFDERETVSVRPASAKLVGGDPPRAFGTLGWLARARGTTIPERSTVFVALVYESGAWRITQIRLLP